MATVSIACPNCNNDLWEIMVDTAECTNCGYERPFSHRKSNVGNPTQLIQIEVIKQYFLGQAEGKLSNWEVTFQEDTGFAYVSVDTSDNPYINRGGSFKVGPRGKVECFSVHNLSQEKGFWKSTWERRFSN